MIYGDRCQNSGYFYRKEAIGKGQQGAFKVTANVQYLILGGSHWVCAYVKTFIKLCDAQVIKNMYILIKIPAVFFAENDKLILTSIWEIQGIQNSQNTFGKKKQI